jgi:hypothetical protein
MRSLSLLISHAEARDDTRAANARSDLRIGAIAKGRIDFQILLKGVEI